MNSLREFIAGIILALSKRVQPRPPAPESLNRRESRLTSTLHQIASLPFGERVDIEKANAGVLAARFSALDPIWSEECAPRMVPLCRHIQALCATILKMDEFRNGAPAIFEQLRPAYSLTEVSADKVWLTRH